MKNYAESNNIQKLKTELKKNGLSDTEEIFDPKTGKTFNKKVLAGPAYMLKLDKTVNGCL